MNESWNFNAKREIGKEEKDLNDYSRTNRYTSSITFKSDVLPFLFYVWCKKSKSAKNLSGKEKWKKYLKHFSYDSVVSRLEQYESSSEESESEETEEEIDNEEESKEIYRSKILGAIVPAPIYRTKSPRKTDFAFNRRRRSSTIKKKYVEKRNLVDLSGEPTITEEPERDPYKLNSRENNRRIFESIPTNIDDLRKHEQFSDSIYYFSFSFEMDFPFLVGVKKAVSKFFADNGIFGSIRTLRILKKPYHSRKNVKRYYFYKRAELRIGVSRESISSTNKSYKTVMFLFLKIQTLMTKIVSEVADKTPSTSPYSKNYWYLIYGYDWENENSIVHISQLVKCKNFKLIHMKDVFDEKRSFHHFIGDSTNNKYYNTCKNFSILKTIESNEPYEEYDDDDEGEDGKDSIIQQKFRVSDDDRSFLDDIKQQTRMNNKRSVQVKLEDTNFGNLSDSGSESPRNKERIDFEVSRYVSSYYTGLEVIWINQIKYICVHPTLSVQNVNSKEVLEVCFNTRNQIKETFFDTNEEESMTPRKNVNEQKQSKSAIKKKMLDFLENTKDIDREYKKLFPNRNKTKGNDDKEIVKMEITTSKKNEIKLNSLEIHLNNKKKEKISKTKKPDHRDRRFIEDIEDDEDNLLLKF